MKVLHLSDNPLPDTRIEKMAYLSKKKGWIAYFAGPECKGFRLGENVFHQIHVIEWNRYARLGIQPYCYLIKRKISEVVSKIKPDIIHAHNLFTAKMVRDLGYPFVFDDHELVSLEKKSEVEWGQRNLIDGFTGRFVFRRWSDWENEVSSKAPIITVSNNIAEAYRKLGSKVFVVPNYPSLFELSKAQISIEKEDTFTAVYLGNDIASSFRPYRNVRGLLEVFRDLGIRLIVFGDLKLSSDEMIISKGYIPHLNLYNVMSRYHVGLLPWKKHWFHKYANPNKPYLYAHTGLIVISSSSLINVIKAFKGKVRTIEDYSNLKEILLQLSQDMDTVLKEGRDTKKYAANNFIFEKLEKVVMEAYRNI